MSLFAISDLHLSTDSSTNKSMEIFGERWRDYIRKIEYNWNSIVSENDTVVIPGDISWSLTLAQAESDLRFVNSLNGKKLLGKGNHDFWWSTAKKMTDFFEQKGFDTLSILYNNAYICDGYVICGTRGWFPDEGIQTAVNNADYDKIINREVLRLRLSLDCAKKLQQEYQKENSLLLPIAVFLHFPPIWNDFAIEEMISALKEYEVRECFYGHIHNVYNVSGSFEFDNIRFKMISSDFLNFYPLKI